jgi:hypothetical protein
LGAPAECDWGRGDCAMSWLWELMMDALVVVVIFGTALMVALFL